MQKVIKIDKKVIVITDGGCSFEIDNCSEDTYSKIISANSDKELLAFDTKVNKQLTEFYQIKDFVSRVKKSKILTYKEACIYWKEISGLSLPRDFVEVILNAEEDNDTIKLETYRNFWTLMSLNPDKECRENLFWFLNKWGLKIAKCGFFVAYRNANYHHTEEDGTIVYTDAHSRTTRIKIGEMTTIDRGKCNSDSSVSCSQGLHAGGAGWLHKGYFGNHGLVVLINPVDVVAVPKYDNYGKLRTCAYLPIASAKFNEFDEVIPIDLEDGFDCSYVTKVIYEGIMGTEEDSSYKIEIPEVETINKSNITDKLLDIAMKCITDKNK